MALMSLDKKTFEYRFYDPITVGKYSVDTLTVTAYPPGASFMSPTCEWTGRKFLSDGTISTTRSKKVVPFIDYEEEKAFVAELMAEATKQKLVNPQAVRFELPW